MTITGGPGWTKRKIAWVIAGVVAVLILLVAQPGRYKIWHQGRTAYRLDRWTGTVWYASSDTDGWERVRKRYKSLGVRRITESTRSTPKEYTVRIIPPVSKPLELTIQTTDKAFLQLKSDGEVVFQDVLPKDSQKTWAAKKEFELWTGNAGALELTLNGNRLDGLGRGVKRGVKVTHAGLELP